MLGTLWLLKDIEGNMSVLYYMILHAIGFFYLWKLHPKLFKSRPTGTKAFILSLIGIGFGQVYNRQLIRALIYSALLPINKLITGTGMVENGEGISLILLLLMLFSSVDAGLSAKFAHKKIIKQAYGRELQEKVDKVIGYRSNNHQFAIDTNILMHEPDLLVHLLEKESFELNMSMTVFNELDGLKKNDNPMTRKRAQLAFDIIEAYQRANALNILRTPKSDVMRDFGLGSSPDDKIIGTYLKEYQSGRPNIIFLSNDKGARIIARNVGLPVAEM